MVVGSADGPAVLGSEVVGALDGVPLGSSVGESDGYAEGSLLGLVDVCWNEGDTVDGICVGASVGDKDGPDGLVEGFADGPKVDGAKLEGKSEGDQNVGETEFGDCDGVLVIGVAVTGC